MARIFNPLAEQPTPQIERKHLNYPDPRTVPASPHAHGGMTKNMPRCTRCGSPNIHNGDALIKCFSCGRSWAAVKSAGRWVQIS